MWGALCSSFSEVIHLCSFFVRKEEYPWRFFLLLVEGEPGPPVLDRRCVVGPVCTEFSVQGVCLEDEKDSWTGSGLLPIHFCWHIPLNMWWDDSESPQPVWAPWGHGDLDAEDILITNTVPNMYTIQMQVDSLQWKANKRSPVMITSAARQTNKEMSKFMRCRLWEKSMMESIQSPKL